MSFRLLVWFCFALYVSFNHVLAHMEMGKPYPIRSRLDPQTPPAQIDYNLKSPLLANGSNFPCHGYQNDKPIRTTATYKAGSKYQMTIVGSVTHGGGSCQLSLSYDNGATFKVIKSMVGGCPLTQQYDFIIPDFAPSGDALFAWTWFNEIGNREMYMNCAYVKIEGSSKRRRQFSKRGSFTSMDSLPNIWRANIAGLSSCTTIEGEDPVFANPGPDVVYAMGSSASAPMTQPGSNCDSATPKGQTVQDPDGNGPAPAGSPPSPAGGAFAEGASGPYKPATATSTTVIASTDTLAPEVALASTATSSASTSTSTPATVTPSLDSAFTGPPTFLAFASAENSTKYLPCVPGSFLCTSKNTYLICDQANGPTPFTPASVFKGPLTVAAGMQCVPFLQRFLDEATSKKFADTDADAVPVGWYRSDRYVIA